MVDFKTKQELNALSKEVFGTSSRWQKLVEKGYSEVLTEEVEETVPAEKEGEDPTVQKVTKPIKTASGGFQSVTKRHTIDSVRELMLKIKQQREDYVVRFKKMQEEQKAAQEKMELAKKIHDETSGSANL